jgi:phospholipid/cholesterol/gamma-HCH transport system permease protein
LFEGAQKVCVFTYDVSALAVTSLGHSLYAVRHGKLLIKQLYEVGNRSLTIVSLFGLFVGLILVLYGADQLLGFGQEKYVGLAGLAIVWEFGPVFTAFIMAGRIGSSYAAELGTMKVYDEVDALRSMGVKPEAYLVAPRVLACTLLLPVLIVYADFVALLGGAFMAKVYARVGYSQFFHTFFQNLDMQDAYRSLFKGVVFGLIVAVVGCHYGLTTTGGAEGVGRSTTESVVHSLLAILIANYFLSKLLMI